ncbi:MAG: polysaccharide deacetylase family protein [Gemmatimonadetes bacterium]|nr:polysaccharide deacetylase family protein [Gemmatimonadota bacterium]
MRAILTYHSIDASGSVISIDRATFQRHVSWLAGAGLRAIGLDRLLELPPQESGVAITFDDAFANFATDAWPVLRDSGHDVTLFVPTGHAGGTNAWEADGRHGIPVQPLLDWNALGRLAEEGVTLGSHGVAHLRLTEASDAQLAEELDRSAAQITHETGVAPQSFAYPYGMVDARVAEAAGRRYRFAVTTEHRVLRAREDARRLPRLDSFYLRRPGRIERWGSAGFRRAVTWRNRMRRLRRFMTDGV